MKKQQLKKELSQMEETIAGIVKGLHNLQKLNNQKSEMIESLFGLLEQNTDEAKEKTNNNFMDTDSFRHCKRLWLFLNRRNKKTKILLREIFDHTFPQRIGPDKNTWKWMIDEIEEWAKVNDYKTKTKTHGGWDFIVFRKEAENV